MRKERRSKERSRAWILLPVLGGLLLLLLLAGALFARDALAVRNSLLAAQTSLTEVRSAAGAIDLDAASVALDRADEELAVARSRSGGPLWSLAARLPVAGDSVTVTREVVQLASAALDVAQVAVEEGEQLLGGGLDVRVVDGRIDLAPLAEAQAVLESLPLERLVRTRDRLQATAPEWAPQELLDGRSETLQLADEAIGTIERGQQLLAALPTFLGTEEPRRYFLGVQTPAELRGTGGLIGYYAVLTIDDGRFELSPSEVYEALDDVDEEAPLTGRIAQLGGDITRGATVDEEFRARYDHTAAAGLFSNVNVDPDLPTTAQVALDLYEVRTGERLDGMILVDPVGLGAILDAAGGDLEVPQQVAEEADLPATITPDEFARFVTVDIYEELGHGRSEERKLLLRALGDIAFARVFDGAWDGVAVSRAVGDAAAERHLQVFSHHQVEQAAFEAIDVAGALRAPDDSDLLAVTANNAVGGKQDVHVGHAVEVDIRLVDPRRDGDEATVLREMTVRTVLDNPLPTEGMDTYVIGNCLVGDEVNRCFDGPPGENRTWFSVWTPGDTELREERSDDGRARIRSGAIRGLRVLDRYLDTPSQSQQAFEVDLSGTAPVSAQHGELTYTWTWWAQSKAIPTLLDVTITPPDGWRIAAVEVAGGGNGRGFGVHGDGGGVHASVDDAGRARLYGSATANTTFELQLIGIDEGS